MRKFKKITALLMCSALLISGTGVGIGAEKIQAASQISSQDSILKGEEETKVSTPPGIGEGDELETPDTGQAGSSGEPQDPAQQETIPPLETKTPAETVTPPAVVTTNPATDGSITTGSSVSVGDKITAGNYVYSVVTVPSSDINYGTLKLKSLTEAAKTKATLNIPATVTKDGVTYRVTGIGEKAFTTSTAVKKVIMRKYITFVGVRAFQGLKTLESVTIGENVDTIKKRAFAGCSALRTVTIPSKVKLIGARAFYNCKKLQSVVIESKKITAIKTLAFKYNKKGRYFVIPSGKKTLYQSLLKNCGITVKLYTY